MSDAINLDKLLREEGFDTDEAIAAAKQALVAAKLTRPGKEGIAADKRPAVRQALSEAFFRTCGHADCEAMSPQAGRTDQALVRVQLASCQVCGGSSNRRAAQSAAECLRSRGIQRVLVVGGTPTLHGELSALFAGSGLQFTYVDGTASVYTSKDAANHLRWAQVAVVWGSTPLPHKVSKLYTDDPPASVRVIQISRRGIEAVCQ
jgi:hypothetical protein